MLPPRPRLDTGCRVGRYELLYPIGQGGMGEVWAARLRGGHGFDKVVAAKIILPHLATDPVFRRMFLDEGRMTAALSHPNVVQVFDFGEEDNLLFVVMERVLGLPFARLIEPAPGQHRPPLPCQVVLRVAADACAGLHAAHELRGTHGEPMEIVHRDVSPHNLLVSTSGATKVIDFGIAQARGRLVQTAAGDLKGRVRYMAPEQLDGQRVDRRADVWAMGAVLHEALSGQPPFADLSEPAIVRAVGGRAAWPALPSTVPAPVRDLIAQALSYDPEQRPATAEAMQRQIERCLLALGQTASTTDVARAFAPVMDDLIARDRQARAAADRRLGTGNEAAPGGQEPEDHAFLDTSSGRCTPTAMKVRSEGDAPRAAPLAPGSASEAKPPMSSPRRRAVIAAGLALGIATAAGLPWWLARAAGPRPEAPPRTHEAASDRPPPGADAPPWPAQGREATAPRPQPRARRTPPLPNPY